METSNDRARALPGAALAWPSSWPFMDPDTGHPLAEAIVDTIRDPLLVLDQDLRVVTANRAFHQTFRMNRQDIQGRPVYGLGDGQWDIPELRLLLEDVAPQHAVMEAYEVERDFPHYRTAFDAPECAGGIQSKKLPQSHSPDIRRCH
jgi:PAS domain-containing protein